MLIPLLAFALSAPQAVAPPPSPATPSCPIRVHAIDGKTGKNIVGARIRLRDLRLSSDPKTRRHSPRVATGPDGIACFHLTHSVSDGLFLNANSLRFSDPGPELIIATESQDFTLHLRHRLWYTYFRYLLIGN